MLHGQKNWKFLSNLSRIMKRKWSILKKKCLASDHLREKSASEVNATATIPSIIMYLESFFSTHARCMTWRDH